MNLLGYLLVAIAKMLHLIFNIYTLIIAISVILTWVRPDPNNPIVRIIRQITEPLLFRVRRLMPKALFRTGLDFSPIIVLLAIILLDTILVGLLNDYGRQLLQTP